MPTDTRKQLRTVDITCYATVIQTFSERLSFRDLAEKTRQNYVSCLKIFFAWCVVFLASKEADLLDYDDFRLLLRARAGGQSGRKACMMNGWLSLLD